MRIGIDIDVAPPRMGIVLRPYPNIAIRIDEKVRNPFKVLVLLLDAILFAECNRAAKGAGLSESTATRWWHGMVKRYKTIQGCRSVLSRNRRKTRIE